MYIRLLTKSSLYMFGIIIGCYLHFRKFLEKFILPSDIPVTLPGHHGVATVNDDTDVMFPLVGGEGMACIMACVQIPI